jgi:outer membrane protein assembly factor BamB
MKTPVITRIVPVGLAVAAVVLLLHWMGTDVELEPRLPGADNAPARGSGAQAGPVKIEGVLTTMGGAASGDKGSWSRFRGDNFDAVYKTDDTLQREWSGGGPSLLWSVEMGEGFAGAAILDGRVYVLDYDREGKADVVRCLSLGDGKDIWRYSYPVDLKRWHGMSRTVPAVTDKYVVTIGPKCHVTCLDSQTGKFKWMYNLVAEFGSKVPQWYTAQCPLIDNGRAIIAPAGKEVLMMAVDCETGEIVWKSPSPGKWEMSHSSVVPMEFSGKRFYVYCGTGGVIAVSAADGKVVWKDTQWRMLTSVPTPVIIAPDRVVVSAGYGQFDLGCMMLRLVAEGDGVGVKTEFLHSAEVFGSIQQTPVFYDGHIYGVGIDKQLACLDLEGNVVWRSSSANKFGHGPYMIANGTIYIMDDDGLMRIVEASAGGYKELGSAKVLDGHESWAPMAMANGRLIVRDLTKMICLDIRAK